MLQARGGEAHGARERTQDVYKRQLFLLALLAGMLRLLVLALVPAQ